MRKNEVKHKFGLPLSLQMFAEGGPELSPEAEPRPEPMFTQTELIAKIANRLARERRKYADYNDLKKKLSEYETAEAERQKAAMTEQELLQAELDAAKKAMEAERAARKHDNERKNQTIIRTEFRVAALGVNIRAEAIDDAYTLADKTNFNVDDEGHVIGVKEALEELVASKPYLVDPEPVKKKAIDGPPYKPTGPSSVGASVIIIPRVGRTL